MAAMINCPYCGKLTDPKLENCPHCGGPTRIKPPQPGGFLPETTPTHQCPNCKNPVHEGDIICVRCGTNLVTGQRIAEEQEEVVVREPRRWLPIIGVGLLVFVVLAAMGALVYYLSQDPVAEARTLAATDMVKAVAVLQKYADKHPDDAEAQLLLGKLYWRSQQFAKAATAFTAASKQDTKNVDAAMLAVLAAGKIPGDDGRNQQIAALRRLVENHPKNIQGWYLLALALGSIGDFTGQIEALQKIAGLDPNFTPSRQGLGVAHALQGDYVTAAQELESAVQQAPQNGENAAALGLTCSLAGHSEEAMKWLKQALDTGTTVNPTVKTRLGLMYMAEGNPADALGLLREAKSSPNATPDVMFAYALCLQANQLGTEALVEYERIASAGGAHAGEAAVQMAMIYLNQGNADRANESLQRAQKLGASSAKLLTLQGRIRAQEGNQAAAQQALHNATQADPNYPPAHLEYGLLCVARGGLRDGVSELQRYLDLIGPNKQGTRAAEIELLVNQLNQTIGQGGAEAKPAEAKQEGASS